MDLSVPLLEKDDGTAKGNSKEDKSSKSCLSDF
jgi:hypothetical protein